MPTDTARRSRDRAVCGRELPRAAVRQVPEPQDQVREGVVGEPLLPQPRQRLRGFHHLLDAAEEEVKEALIAYHFLRREDRPLAPAELDRRIEDWFSRRRDAVFDFEIDDGMAKLRRLGLVDDDGAGRFTAISLDEAKRRLDRTWDGLSAYSPVPAVKT